MASEKEHAAAVKASFTASADVITMFGGSMVDQTPKIHTFAKELDLTAKSASQVEKNVNAISKLDSKTSALKQVSDLLKGQNTASSVIGTAQQFAAAQVANGMDPAKVTEMVTAMLTYAGKTQYLKQALTEINASTKDASTATVTWLTKLRQAAGDVSNMSSKYQDLNTEQKAFADGSYQVMNQILDTNTSFQKAIDLANGLTTALGSSANAYKALIDAATNNNDTQLATLLAQMQSGNVPTNIAAIAAKLNLTKTLPKGMDLNSKAGIAWLTDQINKQVIAQNDALKVANKKSVAAAADVVDQQKVLDGLKKQLSAAEKRLKIEQDTANAIKQQQQYQLSQADIDNQIRLAQANGDYLKASLLLQQKASNSNDYNQGLKQSEQQAVVDSLRAQVADAEDSLAKANAKANVTINPPTVAGPQPMSDSAMNAYLKNIDSNIAKMRAIAEQHGVTGTGSSAAPFSVDNAPDFNTTDIKKSLDSSGRIKKGNILSGGLSPQEQSFISLLKASIPGLHGENGGKPGSGSYVTYNGHEYYLKRLDQSGQQDSIIEMGSYAPGRAKGGPVTGGSTYVVGENGPEIFTPSQSGSIIPNMNIGKYVGGLVSWLSKTALETIGVSPAMRLAQGKKQTNWDYLGAATLGLGAFKSAALLPKIMKPIFAMAESTDLTQNAAEAASGLKGGSSSTSNAHHTYNINVSAGSNASADDIAKVVLNTIQRNQNMVSSNRAVRP
jgi:hypothetical protein